jgi:hypothetical protein
MHPRGRDAVDGLNGAGQFTLKRTEPVHLLHKGVHPHAGHVVEDFPTRHAFARQPGIGKGHTRAGNLGFRDRYRIAIARQIDR